MQQQVGSTGVQFIGLTPEDSSTLDKSKAFLDTFGIRWPNGYGAGEAIDALRVFGYPTTFVFGADGRVLWNDAMGGKVEDAIAAALWLREHPE